MWRSFFFAMGAIFIILGLECLMVDRFYVTQEGKLGSVANQALDLIDSAASKLDDNKRPALPTLAGNQSSYSTSRFADPFSRSSSGNGPFQNAGFRNGGDGAVSGTKPPRDFPTQDWMPWSLLAAGAIVVLYTKSTPLNLSHSEA